MRDFARGCMRTYLILKERAARWNADAEIQALLAEAVAHGKGAPALSRYSTDTATRCSRLLSTAPASRDEASPTKNSTSSPSKCCWACASVASPISARSFSCTVTGGERERAEPDLPRHPLGIRCNGWNSEGPAGGGLRLQARVPEAGELSEKRQTIPELNTSHSMSWRALGLGLARCEPPPRLRPPSAHVNASRTASPLYLGDDLVPAEFSLNSSGESPLVCGHVPGTELPADFSAPLPGHVSRIDGFLRQHESPVIDHHSHTGVLPHALDAESPVPPHDSGFRRWRE